MQITVLVRGPFIWGTSRKQRLTFKPPINRVVTVEKKVFDDKLALVRFISTDAVPTGIPDDKLRKLIEECFEYDVLARN